MRCLHEAERDTKIIIYDSVGADAMPCWLRVSVCAVGRAAARVHRSNCNRIAFGTEN